MAEFGLHALAVERLLLAKFQKLRVELCGLLPRVFQFQIQDRALLLQLDRRGTERGDLMFLILDRLQMLRRQLRAELIQPQLFCMRTQRLGQQLRAATLELVPPPGVTGLAAEKVTIPADKTEGTLIITATADATEGQIANAVIRASSDFDGAVAASDGAVAINVSK